MKEEFLRLNQDYPSPNQIELANLCLVSDSDIPSGFRGINREGYTYGQLRRKPIIDELVRLVKHQKIKQFISACNQRNMKDGFTMYKVNGEYCFWGLRLGPIVKLPSESELRIMLSRYPKSKQALQQKVITPGMIRGITYNLLQLEIANCCEITINEAGSIIGNQLDSAPHEDASGYIFMVPNWAHNWFTHNGYVSKMLKALNR